MNEEWTRKCLRQVEHIHGNLWHRYSTRVVRSSKLNDRRQDITMVTRKKSNNITHRRLKIEQRGPHWNRGSIHVLPKCNHTHIVVYASTKCTKCNWCTIKSPFNKEFGEVFWIQLCDNVIQWFTTGRYLPPDSSTNKPNNHDKYSITAA